MDAVISPVAPSAAVIPGKWHHYSKFSQDGSTYSSVDPETEYGSIANVLDYATVVIPVTKANKNLDAVQPDYTPMSSVDKQNWLACTKHHPSLVEFLISP